MQTVIRVENLSKSYIIGHESAEKYTALRDVITRHVKSFFQPRYRQNGNYTEEFYALKDVSFEIKQGERVGIIGKNGAGKSTLLKILSRITEPTSGRISLKGRVSSLLEVGTGFHPELTGRENIFLNGAILGMNRIEIKKKFDEIVAFSEIEKFLDTPVKRYSSGMYVRLAFAVAAHLEPEILIVDEVLAVGDAQFQKKCLGKMEDVSKNEGRTVLFVSHNIGAIKSLCSKGILLNKGQVQLCDNIDKVIDQYSRNTTNTNRTSAKTYSGLLKEVMSFEKIYLNNKDITKDDIMLSPFEEINVKVITQTTKALNIRSAIAVFKDGVRLFSIHDAEEPSFVPKGIYESTYVIPSKLLRPGYYSLALGAYEGTANGEWIWGTDIVNFEILEEWSNSYDSRNFGLINIITPAKRVILQKEKNLL